jgi:hypothetical protein
LAATATLALVLALVPALALALVPATLRVMPLVTSASTQPAQVTFRTQTLIAAQMDFAASQCAPGHQRIRSHALRQQPAVLRATAGWLMLLLLLVPLLALLLLSPPGVSVYSTFLDQVLIAAQAFSPRLVLNVALPDLRECWFALYFGF